MKRRIKFSVNEKDSNEPDAKEPQDELQLEFSLGDAIVFIARLTRSVSRGASWGKPATWFDRSSVRLYGKCKVYKVHPKGTMPVPPHPTRQEVELALGKAKWTMNSEYQHIWYHPIDPKRWVVFDSMPIDPARRKGVPITTEALKKEGEFFRELLKELNEEPASPSEP